MKKDVNFETALKELESIVEKLEKGNLTLDDALKFYEEGIKLSRICTTKLNEAETIVTKLTKELNGQIKELPFNFTNES